ncbi:MAG: 50S ribosomal protein L18 [bacterium]|nr:50S ribosomal protein L18 [bacterium]
MAKGPRYAVPFRRKREGKTNYRKRLKLLLSGKPRLVVRKTNRYIIAHICLYDPKGDRIPAAEIDGKRVAAYVTSAALARYGWKGSFKNLPAAYLTGMLLGLLAKKLGIEEAVLDIGMHRPTKGARVFAVLRGALDAGLRVPHGEEILPAEERIKGEHIAAYARLLKQQDPEKYRRQFSQYIKLGLDPEEIPRLFEETKKRILEELGC